MPPKISILVNSECAVALCFSRRAFSYRSQAERRRAAKQLRDLELLLRIDAQLRALLVTAVVCVAAEADTLIVCYRSLSSVDSYFFPVTHAIAQTWNVLAYSAGFKTIAHQYGSVESSVDLHEYKRDRLTSSQQTEEVLRCFISRGFMQITPFEVVAQADTELVYVDPKTPFTEIEKRADALAKASSSTQYCESTNNDNECNGKYH